MACENGRHYWRNQGEEKVLNLVEDNPTYIVSLAYEAWADADCYIIFHNMAQYEEYKADHFTSIYSGWITLDFAMPDGKEFWDGKRVA